MINFDRSETSGSNFQILYPISTPWMYKYDQGVSSDMIITRWTHVLNENWSIEIMFQFHPIILICRKITVLWRYIMIKVSRDFEHKLIDVKQQSLWLLTQYLIIGIRNFRTKNNFNAHIPIWWRILPNLNVSISFYCPIYIGFDSPNQMVYQTHRANNNVK